MRVDIAELAAAFSAVLEHMVPPPPVQPLEPAPMIAPGVALGVAPGVAPGVAQVVARR